MKILNVSYSDVGGGAAIAALRLTEALRASGHEAVLGVVERHTPSEYTLVLPTKRRIKDRVARRLMGKLERFLLGRFRTDNRILHSLNLFSRVDVDWINASDFDVVHLHWINHDTLSVPDIGKIKKPLVWTMHDSWPVCGAEHHPDCLRDDTGYLDGYARRPKGAGLSLDTRRMNLLRKNARWDSLSISFIAPSLWEEGILRSSFLFKAHPAWRSARIPCIVDANRFRPLDRPAARSVLAMDREAVVIGLGSAYSTSGGFDLKGGHLIKPVIEDLSARNPDMKLVLLVFGPVTRGFVETVGVPVFPAGFVANEAMLNLLYNCCDVFLCPSIVESFGLTVLEAANAGVPSVAFKATGVVDLVEHRATGYLAEPYKAEGLADGIEWCLANPDAGAAARLKALRDFNPADIVKTHLEYYSQAMSGSVR